MTIHQPDTMELHILAIDNVSPNVKTFTLEKPDGWQWAEGAHARFGVIAENGVDQRTMSVSSLPHDQVITMTTRRYAMVSPYKAALWEKRVWETLQVSTPRSRFTLPREARPVLLLGMGVGMATLLPLIRSYQADSSGIDGLHVLTVDREIDLLNSLDLRGITRLHVNNRVQFTKALDQVLNAGRPIVMPVGSDRFIESVIRQLKAHGFTPADVRLDKKSSAIRRIWELV